MSTALDPEAPAPRKPLDAIHQAALAYAKRFNRVCDNGQIVCLRCDLEATLPSLLCAGHLLAHQGEARR